MTKDKLFTGLDALKAMFEQAHEQNRAAFLPYYTIGYPTYEQSLDVIEEMAKVGVDGFEIGIPFSDPIADGPIIQEASQVALENGITPALALEAVRELRSRGVTQPMLMFSYLNPVLAYGAERWVADASEAGADGFIIPDLPPEEAPILSDACVEHGMALIFFLAPTTNPKRIELVQQRATGFIYVLSVAGVTGARRELPADLTEFISKVKAGTNQPLVIGFGISTPEQARRMNDLVEGFIVGSALIRAARSDGIDAVKDLASSLRAALDN